MPAIPFQQGVIVVGLFAMGACSLHVPTPLARVTKGPAFDDPPFKLLALPAVCRSADFAQCHPAHEKAVDSAARMSLEFAGYTLVDSEQVNSHTRARIEHTSETRSGTSTEETSEVTVTGTTFGEATPAQQRALMVEMGLDGLLHASVLMGPARGASQQRTVQVQLQVTRIRDDRLAWSTRCSVETGDFHSTEQAIELATRCALDGAALYF